jgi:hypothetical protein
VDADYAAAFAAQIEGENGVERPKKLAENPIIIYYYQLVA